MRQRTARPTAGSRMSGEQMLLSGRPSPAWHEPGGESGGSELAGRSAGAIRPFSIALEWSSTIT